MGKDVVKYLSIHYIVCEIRRYGNRMRIENAIIMFSSSAIGATWQRFSIEEEDRGDQWCESTTILLLVKLEIIL